MKKAMGVLGVLLCLGLAVTAGPERKILEFDVMAGVAAPYTGNTNPIRGVPGGGIPWRIEEGKGELRADGKLEVEVRGLVLNAGANAGTNPIASFHAIVSCQSRDADTGAATVANVMTAGFPATPSGDAQIEAQVVLPSPCYAPVIFVTSPPSAARPQGAWFAVTGQ